MTYADINKRFTQIVTEYICKGYAINTSTMSGSQGEIANIDLTNGKEIIRVLVDSFTDWHENLEGVKIIVGRSTDNVRPHSGQSLDTVWNGRLEIIRTECFYRISRYDNFYGTREDAEIAKGIRYIRYARRELHTVEYKPSDKAMAIAKKIVHQKLGYSRVNSSEVRLAKTRDGYRVSYRGKVYYLH